MLLPAKTSFYQFNLSYHNGVRVVEKVIKNGTVYLLMRRKVIVI